MGAFPRVCVDKDFSYGDEKDPQTQLKAAQEACEAFRVYSTCRYLIQNNFSEGIAKISAVVGKEVTRDNVRKLKNDIERKLDLTPEKAPSPFKRIRNALRLPNP